VDRRQFLESIAGFSTLVPGLALLPVAAQAAFAEELHARARTVTALRTLSPAQDATLSCIAEILLPETDTVGARGVGVNRFIDLLLTEAMLETERDKFLAGLDAIGARSQELYQAPPARATREQQQALIAALDAQLPARVPTPAETHSLASAPMTAERGYATLKQLVVLGYFTSEPVARGLIKAPIIPGRYDGCVST
jgi:gluconate 2-dehydrogenase gamma chain